MNIIEQNILFRDTCPLICLLVKNLRVNDKFLTQSCLTTFRFHLKKITSGHPTTATYKLLITLSDSSCITLSLRFFLISLPTQWYSVSVASKIAIQIRKWSVRPRNKIPSDQMQSSNFCHKPPVQRSRRSGT
jgi:hypothetical protein